MIKGIQKQMVMVRLQKDAAFEAAYFVLRDGYEKKESEDIVREANEIAIRTSLSAGGAKRRQRQKRLLYLLIPFLTGVAVGVLSLLLARLVA